MIMRVFNESAPKWPRALFGFGAGFVVTLVAVTALAHGSSVRLAPSVQAPVIHERFTPLPCSGEPGRRTTQQQLGCAEHAIVRIDGRLDQLAKSLMPRLPDNAARRRFATAAHRWLSYRNADRASVSDVFEGGTEAPVLQAQCLAARDRTRLADLGAFSRSLPG